MKLGPDLIDAFTDLVVDAVDRPHRLGDQTLGLVLSLMNARSAAIFVVPEGGQPALYTSRSLDQQALEAVHTAWSKSADGLKRGEPFYVPDRQADPRLPKEQRARTSPGGFVVLPIKGTQGGLAALLYVDSHATRFCTPPELERLEKVSRIVARAVSQAPAMEQSPAIEQYLENTSIDDIERQKLLLLLDRNAWNIARVARLMGMTRRTIYLKLARYKIQRVKVRRGRARRPRA